MKTKSHKLVALLVALSATITASLSANVVERAWDKINEGDIILDNRLRFEHVDQDDLHDANALTNRVRFGYETAAWNNFKLLAEYEGTWAIPSDSNHNSTTNGKTGDATVADPDNSELNRLQLSWDGLYDTDATFGRQRINLDNQRFIGASGWRQNEVTYDALLISNQYFKPFDRQLTLTYGYLKQVNTVFGRQSSSARLHSDSNILHAKYDVCQYVSVTGYGYLLEFDNSAAKSSNTWGVAFTGSYPLRDDIDVNYRAEFATQEDAGKNTTNYDADYLHLATSADIKFLHVGVGYEVLGSDKGVASFQTPLGTNHKFGGWADTFLTTPDAGLEDFYAWGGVDLGKHVKLKGIYHKFDADEGGKEFGHEADAVLDIKVCDNLGVKFTYAQLFAEKEGGKADKIKGTFQIDFKY